MNIVNMKITDIHPYEKNPRINDAAVEVVAKSIKEFGWQQPIVVDKDMVIIVGHTRLRSAELLGLTEVQEGVLNIVFHIADDNGLLLLDLKDLRTMVNYVGEHAKEYTLSYGQIATQSIGAIQRALLQLQDAGGDIFFGDFSNIIVGTLMYTVLNNGLVMMGFESQTQQLIKGVIFLLFVALTIDRKALKVIK